MWQQVVVKSYEYIYILFIKYFDRTRDSNRFVIPKQYIFLTYILASISFTISLFFVRIAYRYLNCSTPSKSYQSKFKEGLIISCSPYGNIFCVVVVFLFSVTRNPIFTNSSNYSNLFRYCHLSGFPPRNLLENSAKLYLINLSKL